MLHPGRSQAEQMRHEKHELDIKYQQAERELKESQQKSMDAMEQKHARTLQALANAREHGKDERALRIGVEAQLGRAEQDRIAALRQQDAELRSNNTQTHARALQAGQLQKRIEAMVSKRKRACDALATEIARRKEAEKLRLAEQDAAVHASREHLAALRSNNQRAMDQARASESLRAELARARQLEQATCYQSPQQPTHSHTSYTTYIYQFTYTYLLWRHRGSVVATSQYGSGGVAAAERAA